MTTLTVKINERSSIGKAIADLLRSTAKESKAVKLIEKEEKNLYSSDFVEKIKKAEEDIKNGKITRINPENVWENIL
jgi:anthranilate/para-aminobenzoate synthase component I